jgi:hypothetical protein
MKNIVDDQHSLENYAENENEENESLSDASFASTILSDDGEPEEMEIPGSRSLTETPTSTSSASRSLNTTPALTSSASRSLNTTPASIQSTPCSTRSASRSHSSKSSSRSLSQTHRKPLSEKSNTKASENAAKSSKIF